MKQSIKRMPRLVNSDYQEHVPGLSWNRGNTAFINIGEQIAQMFLVPLAVQVELEQNAEFAESSCGASGFDYTSPD